MVKLLRTDNRDRYVSENGDVHRPNGPAVIWEDGTWNWSLYGKFHRYYGPAFRYGSWYIHGGYINDLKNRRNRIWVEVNS